MLRTIQNRKMTIDHAAWEDQQRFFRGEADYSGNPSREQTFCVTPVSRIS
jgi:hypothetical protein